MIVQENKARGDGRHDARVHHKVTGVNMNCRENLLFTGITMKSVATMKRTLCKAMS